MKVGNFEASTIVKKASDALENDKNISISTKQIFKLALILISTLLNKLGLNSSNSSKPPSSDENRKKKNKNKSHAPRGGQKGHKGSTLKPVDNPNVIKSISIDRRTLDTSKTYKSRGYSARQVIDIKISVVITEYRAEVLIDSEQNEYVAEFPEWLTRPIQYGASVKANATYFSTYQLIPYERLRDQFKDEYNIPISKGSIYNFNCEASSLLTKLGFDKAVKQELVHSSVANADETGININGKKIWLHDLSNEKWTWLSPHVKRGSKAMDDIGIIPLFSGTLCHDHWKPYFKYSCKHSLCNAHHLRELTRAHEQDGQNWAEEMRLFLLDLNDEVDATKKGALSKDRITVRKEAYKKIILHGDKECPAIEPKQGKKRKPKQTKSRNLLKRLCNYENEVLRFMEDPLVPFTNNQGERDIRMSKVQQKISGCFRSMEGAVNFCRVRSYLSSCKKNGVSTFHALELLFNGKLPEFIMEKLK